MRIFTLIYLANYYIMLLDNTQCYSMTDSKGVPLETKLDVLFKFKTNGFYIELGGFDGLTQSNTAFFEFNRNWSGILIEPSINAFEKCRTNRPNSIVLNYCCVSNEYNDKKIKGDFDSSIMSSVNGVRLDSNILTEVDAITLNNILDQHCNGKEITFLSLDTEGYELFILQGLNLNKYRPKFMLIEIYNKDYNAIQEHLNQNNYKLHSNFTNYNNIDNPIWDGTHNDYLFYDITQDPTYCYNNVITGEKIQQMCDLYLGLQEDFNYNPIIKKQLSKHLYIDKINIEFDNPKYIFCYSHRINILTEKIKFFKNKFILVTGNSDENVRNCPKVLNILNNKLVIKWYAQNVCFEHNKLILLPIGIANSQWNHGNYDIITNQQFNNDVLIKQFDIYFNFNVNTNKDKRLLCYNSLISKIPWLNNISHSDNMQRFKSYKFCICPEGNGVDTHRLWEALYLRVVPIVIKNEFIDILKNYELPIVILDKWSDLELSKLNYDDYDFTKFFILNANIYNFKNLCL